MKTHLGGANILQEPQGFITQRRYRTCPGLQVYVPSYSLEYEKEKRSSQAREGVELKASKGHKANSTALVSGHSRPSPVLARMGETSLNSYSATKFARGP